METSRDVFSREGLLFTAKSTILILYFGCSNTLYNNVKEGLKEFLVCTAVRLRGPRTEELLSWQIR